jgi:hypothetical protein
MSGEMAPLLAAGTAECVDCHPDPMDPDATYPYHVGAHNALQSEIAANSAGCVSCHGSNLLTVLPAGNPDTGVSEHKNCSCHAYGEATADKMACEDCHTKPGDPAAPHPYHVNAHDAEAAAISGTKSSACTACHGTNVLDVSAGSVHIAGEHKNCSCHAYGEAGALKQCVDCHAAGYAPHGFFNGLSHTGSGWVAASGHNTTTYGILGPKTLFDGSEGPVLKWEAVETTTLTGFADGRNGTYTEGQIATMTTAWDFPTVNVFWASDDASAPASAIKGLTKDDVITCQDCHTGLNVAGPHGAAQNWGLDPNYPGDYSYAELTKYVTANMAYASANNAPFGSWVILNAERFAVPLSVSGIAMFPGAATHADITSSSVAATATVPGWVPNVSALGNRTDGTQGPTAVICAKCHDLENYNALSNIVEGANTAHDSHHQDQLDGSAQCVGCHIGVPHGWKMPRLLVDTDVDVAPYKDPQFVGTTRTASSGNNTGNTIKLTPGFGQGFNGQGMQALSGVNEHTLGGPGGTQPYNSGDGLPTAAVNLGHVGTAYWSEPQCQACGIHMGETPAEIINEP